MKKISLLIAALSSVVALKAAPVDPQQAMQTAQAFVDAQNATKAGGPRKLKMAYESKNQLTAAVTKDVNYYVFNVNEKDGFVIVSGDDRTAAILGSTDNGTFDAAQLPDNLRWWLSCYDQQIEWVKENMPERTDIAAKSPSEVIAPLLTTRWDQGEPYNFHSPAIGGVKCATGCLATALAQIMNYHKWPQEPTRSIPSYTYESRTIEALPAITFDWDHMLDSYTSSMVTNGIATPEVEAMSWLMRYAGQSVKMNYGTDGSGSNQDYLIPYNLKNYFGYANTCWAAQRINYSIGEWEELFMNELRNNRPILYCGYTSAWEGHAFVCDGYNGDGRFNINWGWGGYADGPFRLSVLDASYSGIGGSATSNQFSVGQIAYLGIQPTGTDTESHYSQRLTVTDRPSVYQRTVTRASASTDFKVVMHMTHTNNTGGTYTRSLGYALYKDGEQVKRLMSMNLKNSGTGLGAQASYSGQNGTTTVNFGAGLADGDYEIYAVSQNISTLQWEKDDASDRIYIKAHIEGNTLTLTPMPEGEFTINNVTQTKNALVVDFTNDGEEYNGPFYLQDSEIETVSWEQIAVAAGETTQVAFYIPDGSSFSIYDVYYLSTDYFQDNWFYTNAILEGSDIVKTVKILNLADDGKTVYGSRVLCQIDVTNQGTGTYRHAITTDVRNMNNNNTNTVDKKFYEVPAGETIHLNFEISVTKAQRGIDFELTSTHTKADGSKQEDKLTYTPENGAVMWTGSGEISTAARQSTFVIPEGAAAADVATAYTKDVTANSNPNTIYLLESAVPTGLKGKNIVNAQMRTGNAHLYDGYEYYIPRTMNATVTCNYHRTFTEADTWSTIALPFAPTAVTAEGVATDWQRSESDTGKSLYIMKLVAIDGDQLIFVYADQLEANTPYLIAVGEELKGKELIFTANGQTALTATPASPITATAGSYQLTGVNTPSVVEGAYLVEGNYATPANGKAVEPFRAYLNADGGISYSQMKIVTGKELTGIHDIRTTTNAAPGAVYNLSGQRVGQSTQTLPKGIYVIDGKKVVVK